MRANAESNEPEPESDDDRIRLMTSDSLADWTSSVLDQVETELRRYCVLPSDAAYTAVALWIVTTHVLPAFDVAPGLVITSPFKRSGKTRLLEVAAALVHDPLKSIGLSAPVFFRSTSRPTPPTVLIDEADGIFGPRAGGTAEALRTLINSAHLRGQMAHRMGGARWDQVQKFETFSMVCLAGIGRMPSTVEDRAVVIRMRRISGDERPEPYRISRDRERLLEIGLQISEWAPVAMDFLKSANVDVPVADRDADTWEPLLCVSHIAGSRWQEKARRACIELTEQFHHDDVALSRSERLLLDIRSILSERPPSQGIVATDDLLRHLHDMEESEWADEDLSARGLAQMLAEFDIRPRRNARRTFRGYAERNLEKAFDRYLPTQGPDSSDGSDDSEADA